MSETVPADAPSPRSEFDGALAALTPRAWVTPALIAANALVYAVMVARGVHPLSPTVADLIAWGADYGPRTTDGEAWRLFTSMFLHIGAIHLAMNMYVLWSVGRLVERMVGNAGFLLVYLVAGVAGAELSVAWNPYVVSAGASGAVFGVYGVLLGFVLRSRSAIPQAVAADLLRRGALFVGYNVFYGMTLAGIDNAAHLGGLAAGLACGLALGRPLTPQHAAGRTRSAAIAAAGGVALFAAAYLALPRRADYLAELERVTRVESDALDAFNAALVDSQASRIGDDEFARRMETVVLPPWREEEQRLAAIEGLPDHTQPTFTALSRYFTGRREGFELIAEGLRAHDTERVSQGYATSAAAQAALSEFNAAAGP